MNDVFMLIYIVIVLVANKIDLNDEEDIVQEEEGKELAEAYGIGFFLNISKNRCRIKRVICICC